MIGVDRSPDVSIRMPATAINVGVARLVAAALGCRAWLPVDAVDELRMAVDELCTWMIGDVAGPTGREFVVTLSISPGCVEAAGTTTGRGWTSVTNVDRDLSDLSRRILDALADDYRCTVADDVRAFTLLKRSSP